jgi:hypothetical protein
MLAVTRHSSFGPYVRGRLALAGLGPRTSISTWCDAVWAILAEAPADVLDKLADHFAINEAARDPERARETWGLLPEHQAGAAKAESAPPPMPGGVPR